MSTCIETTSSRAGLLGELPAHWVQTIVTSPSRADLDRSPAALFTQLHRVLRDDGTLWLLCADKYLPDALAESGWIARRLDWATPLRVDPAGRARLHLFVKQSRYHYNTPAAEMFLAPRAQAALACVTVRRHGCAWSPEHRRELIRSCVIAATARVACGACGTPYTRTASGDRRPACAHHNPCGRCLVLDPFYDPAHGTLDVARQTERSFLGIVDSTDSGDQR
jgi:hypothetical protein